MQNLFKQLAADGDKLTALPTVNPVDGGDSDVVGHVTNIINAVIGVLGIACVIIIIVGGIGYMTSAGDSGKVKKAKDTILYGLIGLAVCVLAFAIVNWVIT